MGIFSQNTKSVATASMEVNLLPESDFRRLWLFASMINGDMLFRTYQKSFKQINFKILDQKLCTDDSMNLVVKNKDFKKYFPDIETLVASNSTITYVNPGNCITTDIFPNLIARCVNINARKVRGMRLESWSALSPVEFTNTDRIENCFIKTNMCTLLFRYDSSCNRTFPLFVNTECPFLSKIGIEMPTRLQWDDPLDKFIKYNPFEVLKRIKQTSTNSHEKLHLFNFRPRGRLIESLGLSDYKDLNEIQIYLKDTQCIIRMIRFNSDIIPMILPDYQSHMSMCTDDGWIIGYSIK